MATWWLKLLGVDPAGGGGGGRVVETSLVLRGGGGGVWVLLAFLLMAAGVVWLYRREVTGTPAWRRWTMAGLRVGFLGLLLLIFLRPGVRVVVEGDVRRQLVILLDATRSMTLQDARTDDADVKRAAMARGLLDPAGGLDQPLPATLDPTVATVPRDRLVREMLASPRLDLLKRLGADYDLRVFTFGRAVEEPAVEGDATAAPPTEAAAAPAAAARAVATLAGKASATALGDAVRDVVSRTRGQPVAGVFVVTDGASNAGLSPLSAAQATGGGVPLYLWGVGLTRPKDVAVSQLFAPEVGFIDDEVLATVRVRSTNLEGQSATVRLKLGDEVVSTQPLVIGPDGEATVTARFTPKAAGEFALTVDVAPLPGEVATDNNVRAARLRVVDGKIKVLYVEARPRWEFKYLQAMLQRDRRAQAKFLLLEASPGLSDGTDSPYLPRFPATKEDLFKYDLVILGDVDPKAFTSDQLRWMEEHVSRFGAGLVMLAGRQRSPQAWTGTPLEKLIPVEWDASAPSPSRPELRQDPRQGPRAPDPDTSVRLELTPAGRASTMLRLADTDAESATVWAKLPPVYWTARVVRARPGADVLAVDPDPAKATRFGKMPVLAIQQFGLGTTMFVGTDNLWRWRRNTGDLHHARLWGQIVQRLALPHLLGESKRTRLTSDKRVYAAGETASVFARLYSPTFEPVTLPSVRGFLTPAGKGAAARTPVVLRAVPDQPGMYRGEAVLPAPGTWAFTVDTDDQTSLDLTATDSTLELDETAMNEPLLRDMARLSGGAYLREEDLHTLPDLIKARADRVRSTFDAELWSSPLYFGVLLVLVGLEWALRKGAMLK